MWVAIVLIPDHCLSIYFPTYSYMFRNSKHLLGAHLKDVARLNEKNMYHELVTSNVEIIFESLSTKTNKTLSCALTSETVPVIQVCLYQTTVSLCYITYSTCHVSCNTCE